MTSAPLNQPSIGDSLQTASQKLSPSDSSRLDAEILLCFVLKKPRSFLYARPETRLNTTENQRFNELLQRRIQGEPIAYITGEKEFWSLPIQVNTDTLIPRPETEHLVEATIKASELLDTGQHGLRALDLATGSGCIALALASEKPHWEIVATDISKPALQCAHDNATRLNITNITFIHSDWFAQIPEQPFDLIISNPPYIAHNDPNLSRGDVRFEPQTALLGGESGLDAYRKIIPNARPYLNSSGILLLEIGFDQAGAIMEILETAGYTAIRTEKDLQGHDRVCIAKRDSLTRACSH